MSAIKTYLHEQQAIAAEIELIAEEIQQSQRETQITDWIYIDDNDSITDTNSVPTLGSIGSMQN